jgi:hypothetical protein
MESEWRNMKDAEVGYNGQRRGTWLESELKN